MEKITNLFSRLSGIAAQGIRYLRNLSRKQILLAALVLVALLLLWYVAVWLWFIGKEAYLLRAYADKPDKKQFVEWIKRDKDDLAKSPERAHRIGATMDVGLQWYNLREFDLAARWWEKGLNIEPDNDIGWYNLGNAYMEQRDFGDAEDAYRQSMEIAAPGETNACLALGEMYRYVYTKKKKKEDNVYLECLKKHKNDRDLIARLAIYYRDGGNIKKAIKYFDKLLSIESTPDVAEELRNLRLKQQEEEQN